MPIIPIASMLMAAGAYRRYKQDQEDADERAEDRKFVRAQRERQASEWSRQDTMRRDLGEAAAPVTVEPNMTHGPEMDDRDVGTPGAVLTQDGYRVGQVRMADLAVADKAAAAANDPRARTTRIAGVYEKHGEVDKAASMRANARQEEVAELQLDEARAQKLTREYDRRLHQVPDAHDAIAAFISDTKGDGQGGGIKAKAVLSPDGKMVTYHQINADGSSSPTPYTFPNTREGAITAKFMLSQGISPKEKLAHIIATAESDERRRQWEADFGLRKDAEARRAAHESRMLTMAERTARAAEAKGAGAVATPDSTFDAKTAADIAKEQVKEEAAEARSKGVVWSGAQIARRTDEIVQSLRQTHTARFMEEAVTRSLRAAMADPAQYADAFAKAGQLGFTPQRLQQMGFKAPGGAAQPAALAPRPATAAVRAALPAPTQPQPALAGRASPPASQEHPEVEQAGVVLDAARAARRQAEAAYRWYGLRQTAVDPKGAAKAEADYRAALEAERAAGAQYEERVRRYFRAGAAFTNRTP